MASISPNRVVRAKGRRDLVRIESATLCYDCNVTWPETDNAADLHCFQDGNDARGPEAAEAAIVILI